jgi:hypothetical protein
MNLSQTEDQIINSAINLVVKKELYQYVANCDFKFVLLLFAPLFGFVIIKSLLFESLVTNNYFYIVVPNIDRDL